MTAAPAAPVERAVKPEVNPIALIDAKFPIKSGEYKRILPLWDIWYRVNFHDTSTNVITRSYFVSCIRGTVKVRE